MLKHEIARFIASQDLLRMSPTSSVANAAARMAERHLGAVIVADGEDQLGIFTERDMLEKVVAIGRAPKDTVLGDVMTLDPASIAPTDTVLDAIFAMKEHRSRHLLVRANGNTIGILSVRDILRAVIVEHTEDHRLFDNLWEGFPV